MSKNLKAKGGHTGMITGQLFHPAIIHLPMACSGKAIKASYDGNTRL